MTIYTSSGGTVVPAGVTRIAAKLTGPGGGGAGATSGRTGGGGGSGGVSKGTEITVVSGETLTWTLPDGGAGGPSATNTPGGAASGPATLVGSISGTLLLANAGSPGNGNPTNTSDGTGGAGASTSGAVGPTLIAGNPGVAAVGGTAPDGGGAGGTGAKPGNPGGVPGGGGGGKQGSLGSSGGAGGRAELDMSWAVESTPVFDYGRVVIDGSPHILRQPQIKISGVMRNITGAFIVKSGVPHNMFREVDSVDPDPDPPPSDVPAYVPTAYQSLYNTDTGIFNANAGNTANIKAGLQNANSSLREWVAIGDSVSEGWTSLVGVTMTEDRNHAFPLMMRDRLASQLSLTIGGDGQVRTQSAQLLSRTVDKRWTNAVGSTAQGNLTGPATGNFGHYVTITNTVYNIAFTPINPGRYMKVFGLDLANIEYQIDGGATQVLTGTGTGVPKTWTIDCGTDAAHNITLSPATTGGTIAISGATLQKSVGLMIHNIAQGGSQAYKLDNQKDWTDTSLGYGNMLPFYSHANMHQNAEVVFIELGGNDMQQLPVDYDAIANALVTIGNAFPNADKVLVNLVEGNGFQGDYNQLWDKVFTAAAVNDWVVFDGKKHLVDYDTMVDNGWATDGFGHLTTTGATYFGNVLADALLDAVGL